MRYDVAPCRLLIWLAAAAVGWAVVIGMCLYVPQAFAGVAVAAVLLWRRSQRPVDPALPSQLVASLQAARPAGPAAAPVAVVPAAAGRSRSADEVRRLVATSF